MHELRDRVVEGSSDLYYGYIPVNDREGTKTQGYNLQSQCFSMLKCLLTLLYTLVNSL